VVTYDEAAKWLPTDIRESIEISLPCRRRGGVHDWRYDRTEFHTMDSVAPVYVSEHWLCPGCGIVSTTDPEAVK
jgi:hypothetical protein